MIDCIIVDSFIAYCETHRRWCMFIILKEIRSGIQHIHHSILE